MTISSTVRVAGPFVGNGTASVFPFAFKVFAATDLDVIRLASSTGVESTLVLNSDYSVTLNGDQNSNPGGSITLLAGALASGFTLTITSDIANLQPTDLTNQGGFYPEVITDSLDRATIQIQQISDIGDRTLKIPISDGTGLDMELPTAAVRANSFLSFDANGEPTVVSAGSSGAPATITRQVFSGTGSQTVFTLASDPGALGNSAQVYIGGVYQQRSTYTIAGTTLTFSAAPVAGTGNIEFVNFLTSNIGATSADLVTYTPAGSGAVARSAASKFGDTVSVKDFGAVGDGVTNNLAAFRNAIAAINAAGGGTLYVPAGDYGFDIMFTGSFTTNTSIWLCPNLTIVMDAGVTMRVLGTWSAGKKYMLMGANDSGLYPSASNIRIYGNGARMIGVHTTSSVDPDLTHAFWFGGVIDDVQIHDVIVEDCGSCAKFNLSNSLISGCTFARGENVCVSVTDGNNITFENCRFTGCIAGGTPGGGSIVEAGVDVEPNAGETCRDIKFVGCRFDSNYKYGLYAHLGSGVATYGIVVDGCEFIDNGLHGCVLSGTQTGGDQANNVVKNSFFEGNSTLATGNAASLLVASTRGTTIEGNRVWTGNVAYGLRSTFNQSMSVTGNVFDGGGDASRPAIVQIVADIGGSYDGNIITNGYVENVLVQYSAGTMLTDNYISNSAQQLIDIRNRSTNIDLCGNTFANACTSSGNEYVILTGATYCSMTANRFVASEQYVAGTVTAYSAGPPTTVTLDTYPNAGQANYMLVGEYVTVGTDSRLITAFNDTTGVATLASAFTVAPTPSVSTYQITGARRADIGILADTNCKGLVAVGNDFEYSRVSAPYYGGASGEFAVDWPQNKIRSITATQSVTAFDHIVEIDATAGNVTVTLPNTANNRSLNKQYVFKRMDGSANTITIDGFSADTIDGTATKTLTSQYETLTISGRTSGWSVI